MNKYSTYKEIDFLTDDYFVESMLNPTAENNAFWQQLIEKKIVCENEFLSAFMTFKQLHECKSDVSAERIDHLWARISTTNEKNRYRAKRRTFIRYVSVACMLILITLVPYYLFMARKDISSPISVKVESDTIIVADPGNNIQLASKTGVINLEGNEANIEYDEKNSRLKVNEETIEIKRNQPSLHYSYLTVPYGKRAFLKLSDGTSLWVNSGSKIKFPDEFTGKEREIFVEGEIYAEIFRDEKRPFIITTDKLSITVLGTEFNLSAYKDEKTINVVLVHGSVQVEPELGVSVVMEPNQLYTYNNNISTVESIDVEEYISWKEGRLIFHNEPFEKILLRLARYYNVTMILPKANSGITCSGKLELKDDFDKILNGLMGIISFNYAANKNEYRIRFNE